MAGFIPAAEEQASQVLSILPGPVGPADPFARDLVRIPDVGIVEYFPKQERRPLLRVQALEHQQKRCRKGVRQGRNIGRYRTDTVVIV